MLKIVISKSGMGILTKAFWSSLQQNVPHAHTHLNLILMNEYLAKYLEPR